MRKRFTDFFNHDLHAIDQREAFSVISNPWLSVILSEREGSRTGLDDLNGLNVLNPLNSFLGEKDHARQQIYLS
jgi:hypothetical protein